MRTDTGALLEVLRAIAEELPRHERRLNELDAALGDGDHGLTITRCCRAIRARLDLLPDARLHVLANCGHWTMIERTADFLAVVQPFLAG